jgi:hypothetical protein
MVTPAREGLNHASALPYYLGEAMKNIAIANEKNSDFLTDQISKLKS